VVASRDRYRRSFPVIVSRNDHPAVLPERQFGPMTAPDNPGHRPVLIGTKSPPPGDRLNAETASHLLGHLRSRDVAILIALHQYRYLDREQIQVLYFAKNARPSQRRLKILKDLGLVDRWIRLEPPSLTRGQSILMLTPKGARVAALARREDPAPYIRRAIDAREHCFHVIHDIEANDFFVAVAAASRNRSNEGLYHWAGEETLRAVMRQRGSAAAPDGWGRYLTPSGEITFHLEWDRGTEAPQRLRTKIAAYVDYFADKRDADLSNLLFVAPGTDREQVIADQVGALLPVAGPSCTVWTSTAERLRELGALGRVWVRVGDTSMSGISEMPARPRSTRPVIACIAKPDWWNRRPAGGEGA
jgi:Replication-relaxation